MSVCVCVCVCVLCVGMPPPYVQPVEGRRRGLLSARPGFGPRGQNVVGGEEGGDGRKQRKEEAGLQLGGGCLSLGIGSAWFTSHGH